MKLTKATNKILENLATPKQYFELVRALEHKGLEGEAFDKAFWQLRDTSQIKISEVHYVSRIKDKRQKTQQWSLLPQNIL